MPLVKKLILLTLLALASISFARLRADETSPIGSQIEVITANARVGDERNNWGGHQCRIVRKHDNVYTVFTSENTAYVDGN